MPELPEVETVRRGLEQSLSGAVLTRVLARRADLRFALPQGFVQHLTGARILRLTRRGKFILAPLDRGTTLVMHLGMTGRFEVEGGMPAGAGFALAAPADAKHAHIVFETDAGARVTYFDPRRFGSMDLVADDAMTGHPTLRDMGPEPLGEDFDAEYLSGAFKGRRQGAKTLLLDQRIVAGLGNIYVCEALHRAGVSPLKPAGDISRRKVGALVEAIGLVLNEAIEAGGSTLRDFAGADGALGYFQHRFAVYDRQGEPCPRARCNGVVARTVQSGRSTFHCPNCQT
jgi:formamidopyrimidine-DNA glycosylase